MSRPWHAFCVGSMLWWAFFGGFATHDAIIRNAPAALVAAVMCYTLFAATASLWLSVLEEVM